MKSLIISAFTFVVVLLISPAVLAVMDIGLDGGIDENNSEITVRAMMALPAPPGPVEDWNEHVALDEWDLPAGGSDFVEWSTTQSPIIPEPATMGILGVGAAMLVARRRRRKM